MTKVRGGTFHKQPDCAVEKRRSRVAHNHEVEGSSPSSAIAHHRLPLTAYLLLGVGLPALLPPPSPSRRASRAGRAGFSNTKPVLGQREPAALPLDPADLRPPDEAASDALNAGTGRAILPRPVPRAAGFAKRHCFLGTLIASPKFAAGVLTGVCLTMLVLTIASPP